MKTSLFSLAENLVDCAQKAGAESVDVILSRSNSTEVSFRNGNLDHMERSESFDAGLRVLVGSRQAIISSNLEGNDVFQELAERAVAMAKEAPEDESVRLASGKELDDPLDFDLDQLDTMAQVSASELRDFALRADNAAREVKHISQTQASGAAKAFSEGVQLVSNGFQKSWKNSGYSISCLAIAENNSGMERDFDADRRVHFEDLRSPEDIGTMAAKRAASALSPRKLPSGAIPVIFDERISGSLIGHLTSAINGASIVRGSSWARDLLGKKVLPEGIDLIEKPHRKKLLSSRLQDDEGLPTKDRFFVRNGILQDWIMDISTAKKLGLKSTANASRGYSSPPSPSVTNLDLSYGNMNKQELMKHAGKGMLVTSFLGATINPNTGDYSRGVSGFWFENGEISFPVNECTIAGNIRDMLLEIIAGNDARSWVGRRVPSLLVPSMTLASS